MLDSVTMLPLANAPITVTAGALQIDSISDQSGRFLIPDISPGPYMVAATLDGYFAPETNTNLYVTESQTSHITLTMVPACTISGVVLDDSGAPVVNAGVQVMRVTYRNGIPTTENVGGQTSDDNGRYSAVRLRPGEYYVAASPKGGGHTDPDIFSERPRLVSGDADTPSRRRGSGRCQHHVSKRRSLPDIRSGHERHTRLRYERQHDVDCHLPAPRDWAAGRQLRQLRYYFHVVQPMGVLSSRIFFPGVYDVFASLPDTRGFGAAYGKTTVTVNGGDVEGVSITVHSGVDIRGKVTIDGGASPSFNSVRISLQPEDNASRLAGYQQLSRFQPTVDPNGAFTIPAVPEGQYRVQVAFAPPAPAPAAAVRNRSIDPFAPDPTPPPALVSVPLAGAPLGPNAYVADILQGGMTVYNSGISVGTQAFDLLEVRVRTDGGGVDGIVLDGKLIPFAGATVVLAPLVQNRQNPALYRVAISDETGHFSMSAIRPGEYKLLAWDSITPGAYMNAEVLSNYVEKEYPSPFRQTSVSRQE